MKNLLKLALCLSLLLLSAFAAVAETTRADLAKIRVGKEGNFKYWNPGSPALARLKTFVAEVTDPQGPNFVPVKDRIATFDVDGTLLCETAPYYLNWMLTCHRYLHDSSYTPSAEDKALMKEMEDYILANHGSRSEWGEIQPFLQQKAFRGMTQEEYAAYLEAFLASEPVGGLTNLKWGTALYWPMIEVISYLTANDFKVFLCSGVERDMCRILTKDIYDIPPYQMMTSDIHYVTAGQSALGEWTEKANMESYDYTPGERIERGDFKQMCTAANKIITMRRELGQKPILSWGNSTGDFPMFHHTNLDNPRPHISFCQLCDDTTRELGNPTKAEKCKNACEQYGWVPVSMRDDWATIYGPDVQRTDAAAVRPLKAAAADRPIYDLQGRRLQSVQKGLNLAEGHKTLR